MPDVFVGESRQFDSIPCPAGMQRGVCAFVEDVGEEEHQGKVRRKVVLVFESEHPMDDGRPYMLSRTVSASLGTAGYPSALRDILVGWRGRDFTPEELAKFNLSKIIGVNCTMNVVHKPKKKGSGVRAELVAVMPAMKGAQALLVTNREPPKWIAKQKEENEAATKARMARMQAGAEGVPYDQYGKDEPPAGVGLEEIPFMRHGAAEE